MAVLTDEMLMAYADGALDRDTKARVEALLRTDAHSRLRVEMFRATGAPLGQLFQGRLHEPVPSNLVDFVLQHKGNDAAVAVPKRSPGIMTAWRKRLMSDDGWRNYLPEVVTWQLAAAATGALIVGAAVGWMLRGGNGAESAGLAVFDRGQIIARGLLQNVLETSPSGEEARIDGSARDTTVARVSLTFKNKEGSYCREYEVATSGTRNFDGLACRDAAGKWALQVHVAAAARKPGSQSNRPAAGSPEGALDPVIDRMMDGDALGKNEEESVIANGWK